MKRRITCHARGLGRSALRPGAAWRTRRFVAAILSMLETGSCDLSIMFCDVDFMRNLNARHRGKDEPTDVLSFPRDEPPKKPKSAGRPTRVECAGDIAVCLDCVRENAVRFDVPFDEELKRVLIHGILHIAGWDHKDNSPRRAMLRLQERLLDRVSAMEVA